MTLKHLATEAQASASFVSSTTSVGGFHA